MSMDLVSTRREFFFRVYPENMIVVEQQCISKNFNFKSLSFINKITIIKYKISLINFTEVHSIKIFKTLLLYSNHHIFRVNSKRKFFS